FGILLLVPLSPSGKFVFNTLGSEGDAYLVFKGGKASLALYGYKSESPEIDDLGIYKRQDGGWIWTTDKNKKISIRCNVLWIEFMREDGKWDKHWRSLPWQRRNG
ncbi:MAG: hypothetical protein ABIP71_15835, partial [Verrucomicrobiota bacterium]